MKLLTKNFFTRKAAEKFESYLKSNGISDENIEIWSGRDAFGQNQYTVKWYTE